MSNRGKASAKLRAEERAVAVRTAAKLPKATQEQLARVAHHLELVIRDGQFVTEKRVALVDVMHSKGYMSTDLWRAADWFRETWIIAEGPSKGVSSYAEYEDRPYGSRALVTDEQMDASMAIKCACLAMFGIYHRDPDRKPEVEKMLWTVDEQLMKLVIPAILTTSKQVTQGFIGTRRTYYEGEKQAAAAGGVVVTEALERLALHLRFRSR